eukprot:TRINITY_DN32759_c0_g1_i1.p1 TRINITY_DN32759_c0_g1~~TRINITY_DN32759_c0_g1_i1.p1  ORF type:complete len:431 (+),score=74.53 TRINITY_DN32759_c0_g1_i1:38-1294(+)
MDSQTNTSEADTNAARAVQEVLAATNHYATLGAPSPDPHTPPLSTADLRRCYLQVSVRVHPDKNSHPDATRAFQKVAASWAVLGNESDRNRYDSELQSGTSQHDRARHEETGQAYQSPEMSAEDAFAAFAFAAAAAAADSAAGRSFVGAAGSFAEVLFCAKQLVQMRETGNSPDALTVASGGLALSNGLRAAGAAAHAAGFHGASAGLERAAGTLQVVSQIAAVGAVASKVPAVQEALEAGRSSAAEHVQGLAVAASSVKDRAKEWLATRDSGYQSHNDNASSTGGETSAATNLGKALGGISSWAERARQRLSEQIAENYTGGEKLSSNAATTRVPPPSAVEDAATAALPVGTSVRLTGLQGSSELNGQTGEVVGFDEKTQRCRVRLATKCGVKLLKKDNLVTIGLCVRESQPSTTAT